MTFSITKGADSLRTRLLRISAIPNSPIATATRFSPSDSFEEAELVAHRPRIAVDPDETQHHAERHHGKAFDGRLARQRRSDDEAETG